MGIHTVAVGLVQYLGEGEGVCGRVHGHQRRRQGRRQHTNVVLDVVKPASRRGTVTPAHRSAEKEKNAPTSTSGAVPHQRTT